MEFKNLIDMHVHTDSSPDAEHAPILLCEYALRNKIRAIAFTDHCEVDKFYEDHYDRTVKQSFFEVNKAKDVFRGNLIVSLGIELGQAHHDLELSNKILETFKYDIVLGSVHNIRGLEDFYFLDYSNIDIDDLLTKYFNEVYELVEWNKFDVLAHLTYPLRYIIGEYKIDVDMSKYSDIIDKILIKLIENQKALEINTGGLRKKINQTSPNLQIVKRFKELGGVYVTTGSDTHRVVELGEGLSEGMKIALEAGFEHITIFEHRVPILVEIK